MWWYGSFRLSFPVTSYTWTLASVWTTRPRQSCTMPACCCTRHPTSRAVRWWRALAPSLLLFSRWTREKSQSWYATDLSHVSINLLTVLLDWPYMDVRLIKFGHVFTWQWVIRLSSTSGWKKWFRRGFGFSCLLIVLQFCVRTKLFKIHLSLIIFRLDGFLWSLNSIYKNLQQQQNFLNGIFSVILAACWFLF